MNKKILITLIMILAIGIFSGVYFHIQDDVQMEENKPEFQGPVPEGYDEEYFRKTGITQPLEE